MRNYGKRLILSILFVFCFSVMFSACASNKDRESGDSSSSGTVLESEDETDTVENEDSKDDEVSEEDNESVADGSTIEESESTDMEDDDVVGVVAKEAPEDTKMSEKSEGDTVRVYISFSEEAGRNLDECIEMLRGELTDSDIFDIRRRDTTGFAIVATIDKGDVDVISRLSFVKSIEVMEEAETTGGSSEGTISE